MDKTPYTLLPRRLIDHFTQHAKEFLPDHEPYYLRTQLDMVVTELGLLRDFYTRHKDD